MNIEMKVTRFENEDIMTTSRFVISHDNMNNIFAGGSAKDWVQTGHDITITGQWYSGDAHLHYVGGNAWNVTSCSGNDHDGYDTTTFMPVVTGENPGRTLMEKMKNIAKTQ